MAPQPGTHTPFNPGTRWLITDRTAPAWTAVLDLLDDDQWHPLDLAAQAMRDTAALAPSTIRGHLRSASRRGWITTRRGRIRLRDRDALQAALDAHAMAGA